MEWYIFDLTEVTFECYGYVSQPLDDSRISRNPFYLDIEGFEIRDWFFIIDNTFVES